MDSTRQQLISAVKKAGREQSSANVMMLNAIASRFGLNAIEEKALDVLNQLGPLCAGAIAEHTGLATPSVTALIDRLERQGFVKRTRDPKDRRRVIVELNDERYADLYAFWGTFVKLIDQMLEPYSDEQLVVIEDFLKRTTQVMRDTTRT